MTEAERLFRPDPDETRHAQFLERVEQVFSPYSPISLPEFFFGRKREIEEVQAELRAPGRHLAIFGDRGVGKTSLATLVPFFAKSISQEHVRSIRCSSDTTYDDIAIAVLRAFGVTHTHNRRTITNKTEGGIRLGQMAGTKSTSKAHEEIALGTPGQPTNQMIVDAVSDKRGLIVIDDYDRVVDQHIHKRVSELIKHLGDERSSTKVLVVGVAETVQSLFKNNESMPRNLGELRLDRFSDGELMEIIESGAEKLSLRFFSALPDRICRHSDGYASHTHLLCRHTVLHAATRQWTTTRKWEDDRVLTISDADFTAGLNAAISKAENRLREPYEKATITEHRKTQLFQYVVWAVAMSNDEEVHVDEIVEGLNQLLDAPIKKESISYQLGKLIKDERGALLRRTRKGVYKFSDPLMRGYVRLQLQAYNLLERQGQLSFPFMRQDRSRPSRRWAPTAPIPRPRK